MLPPAERSLAELEAEVAALDTDDPDTSIPGSTVITGIGFIGGVRCMVIDTSPRPHTNAARLAESLDGVYLPLPHADAAKLSDAVQTVGRSQTVARGGG